MKFKFVVSPFDLTWLSLWTFWCQAFLMGHSQTCALCIFHFFFLSHILPDINTHSYILTKFKCASQSLHPNRGLFSRATGGACCLEGKPNPLNVTLHLFETRTQCSLQNILSTWYYFPFPLSWSLNPWNTVPPHDKCRNARGPVGHLLRGDGTPSKPRCILMCLLCAWPSGFVVAV